MRPTGIASVVQSNHTTAPETAGPATLLGNPGKPASVKIKLIRTWAGRATHHTTLLRCTARTSADEMARGVVVCLGCYDSGASRRGGPRRRPMDCAAVRRLAFGDRLAAAVCRALLGTESKQGPGGRRRVVAGAGLLAGAERGNTRTGAGQPGARAAAVPIVHH